jgi:hypothetical protein
MAEINGRVGWRNFVSTTPTTSSIITTGLVLNIDAGNTLSYPGTGTTWTDLSGNGNNGTLVNGTSYSSVNGGTLVFDGINDYVVSNSLNITGNVPITINFWCQHLVNQGGDVVSVMYGSEGYSYQCAGLYYRNDENYVRFTTWQSSPGDYNTSFVKDFGVWHYWSIVYSNNTVLVYRDGVADSNGAQSRTINFTSDKLSFGATKNGTAAANIKVGPSHFYNRALTQSEILQNYNSTKVRFSYVTTGLVLNLDAGNSSSYLGTGTTWTDLSGNGNNATLVNGTAYSSANGGTMVFDGINDKVSFNFDSMMGLIPNRPSSVSMWCKFNNTNSRQVLFGDWNSSGGAESSKLEIDGSSPSTMKIQGYLQTGNYVGLQHSQSTNYIQANTWYYVTLQNTSATNTQLYINGVLNDERTTQFITYATFGHLMLGSAGDANALYLNGSISTFQVYNNALTSTEVLQNFNATKSRFGL